MKLVVRHGTGELTIPNQSEFLLLFQRGVIAPDDLVQRDGKGSWVRAADLPWIRGTSQQDAKDDRRLFWIIILMMVLGLLVIVWFQVRTDASKRARAARPAVESRGSDRPARP